MLFADFLVADRDSFVIRAKGRRGKTLLEITAGHGLAAVTLQVTYKEPDTDPKVAAALGTLRDTLNDPNVTEISQELLVAGLGLTFEKFGG